MRRNTDTSCKFIHDDVVGPFHYESALAEQSIGADQLNTPRKESVARTMASTRPGSLSLCPAPATNSRFTCSEPAARSASVRRYAACGWHTKSQRPCAMETRCPCATIRGTSSSSWPRRMKPAFNM